MLPSTFNKSIIKKDINIFNKLNESMNWNNRIDDDETQCEDNIDKFSRLENDNVEDYTELMEKINKLCEKHMEFDKNEMDKYNIHYLEIDNLIKTNLSTYFQGKKSPTKIHICAYQINKSGLHPFLQFFMRKYNKLEENPDTLSFINFEYENGTDILNKCNDILNIVLLSYMKIGVYEFKGFKHDDVNNELFIYYDLSECQIGIHRLNNNNDLWLVLVDEIINYGKVCNFEIDPRVVDFFKNNSNSFFLRNKNGNYIETPIIAYTGANDTQIKFTAVFGKGKSYDCEALMGPYYYFTNYENAVKMVDKNMKSSGIIRFALFVGNMKVPLNLPQDKCDVSLKTTCLVENVNDLDYKKNKNMIRVSDRDALWTENYDSVYIGNVKFDDGSSNEDYPYWVLKIYEQQIPLTYHILS